MVQRLMWIKGQIGEDQEHPYKDISEESLNKLNMANLMMIGKYLTIIKERCKVKRNEGQQVESTESDVESMSIDSEFSEEENSNVEESSDISLSEKATQATCEYLSEASSGGIDT